MNQKEKELFFELCRYRDQNPQKLRNLIKKGAATPAVLGHLFYNRMGGIAFGVLKENGLLGETNREFRNTLESRYVLNREKNESYFRCLKLLTRVLKGCEGKYALLKGAYLCKAYPAEDQLPGMLLTHYRPRMGRKSLSAFSRRTLFCILPVTLCGNASTKAT